VAKLAINKKFFSSWNSEMAYALGFIAADGYLGVKRIRNDKSKQYFLDITSKDFSLLKKLKK
jgi:phage anti-repressor protein